MAKYFPAIFGGAIAYMLLLLYFITVIWMTYQVIMHGMAEEPKAEKMSFPDGVVYVVTTVGGLVSALVVAKLATTKPGENPAQMRLEEASELTQRISTWLIGAYLAVWLLTGLIALVFGVMLYPKNTTLCEIGTTWLGLAVASGYAYFGLRPTT